MSRCCRYEAKGGVWISGALGVGGDDCYRGTAGGASDHSTMPDCTGRRRLRAAISYRQADGDSGCRDIRYEPLSLDGGPGAEGRTGCTGGVERLPGTERVCTACVGAGLTGCFRHFGVTRADPHGRRRILSKRSARSVRVRQYPGDGNQRAGVGGASCGGSWAVYGRSASRYRGVRKNARIALEAGRKIVGSGGLGSFGTLV